VSVTGSEAFWGDALQLHKAIAGEKNGGVGGGHNCARLTDILDLLSEDDRLNVYPGKLEMRPPGAPTSLPNTGGRGRWLDPCSTLQA
jgi:hypothetical protein